MNLWRRADESATSVEVADALVEELSDLRDVHTPVALVASVMGRVTARPTPSLWAWLHRPLRIVLRMSPIGMVSLAATGMALAAVLLVTPRQQHPIPMSISSGAIPLAAPVAASRAETPSTVLVRFTLRDGKARRVAVAGSFNSWNATETVLRAAADGSLFTATVALPRGEHEYMFVVDGRFVTDPDAGDYRPDGFGNQNAVLRL
jgi:hypothetical protein